MSDFTTDYSSQGPVATEQPPRPSFVLPAPPTKATAKELVIQFLKDNPEASFTTTEIARALGLPLNSASALISAYLPHMPISVASYEPGVGTNNNKPVRRYHYDPAKTVLPGNPKTGKPKRKSPTLRPQQQAPKATAPAQRPETNDIFAKIVFRDGRNVILVTDRGEIIKGKVMAE